MKLPFSRRRSSGSADPAGSDSAHELPEPSELSEAPGVPEALSEAEADQYTADTTTLRSSEAVASSVISEESEESEDSEVPVTPKKKRSLFGRGPLSGTKLVALIAAVAVVSLLAGVAVMQFIVSPAELAARTAPPKAGPVTAPVELREIENTVISRGDVTYADAVDVSIDAGGGDERPVITGHVPEAGTVFNAGNIALEVAGRPVIVLPGELPAYRTLSVGMRGPDVVQLKTALGAMGYWAGDPGTDLFEYDTASALGTLYEQIGYTASAGGDEAQETLRQAQRTARDAGVELAQAQANLNRAASGGDAEPAEGEAPAGPPDLSAEQAAVTSATDAVNDAQEALATAQEGVLPTLPSNEALYLSDLPRRVDDVVVSRGDVLSGSPMTVSGATLAIIGTISKQDADLLTEGIEAFFPGSDGEELTATVEKIIAPKGGKKKKADGDEEGGGSGGDSGRYSVRLAPGKLSSEEIEALRGTNVRLRIPVASTDGEVLAVPIAALSAGSSGEDRVELLIEEGDGKDPQTENVPVTAGLAADGFVEISSDDPRIKPGAQLVVGR